MKQNNQPMIDLEKIIELAHQVGIYVDRNRPKDVWAGDLQSFADALLTYVNSHQPLFDATTFWLNITHQIEEIKPPAETSFDYFMGFMEARRMALRTIKQID